MSQGVNIHIEDGQLGAIPVSTDEINVVIGCSSQGTTNLMFPTVDPKKLVAFAGDGPAVEAAAYDIQQSGAPVIFMRTPNTTPATATAVTHAGTGTSVVTVTGTPYDTYQVIVTVVKAGTIATAGSQFTYSLDNGRTPSPVIDLGTATTYAIPRSGLTLNFAAGTLVLADTFKFTTTQAKWTTTDLLAAFTVLLASTQEWGFAQVVGKMSASEAASVDGYMTSAENAFRYAFTLGEARDNNSGEDEATWMAALLADYSGFASLRVAIAAGSALVVSPVSGRTYRRPVAWLAAAKAKKSRIHEDLGKVRNGALGATLFGKPEDGDQDIYHDERNTPGLDAGRFITLTTHIGKQGLYILNPNMMAPNGSDFKWIQNRRVMDKACRTVRAYFLDFVSDDVRLDKKTGFILEKEARDIESGANAALVDALLAPKSASDAFCNLSRSDNLLSSSNLSVDVRAVPKGYLKTITVTIGFLNPVRQQALAA